MPATSSHKGSPRTIQRQICSDIRKLSFAAGVASRVNKIITKAVFQKFPQGPGVQLPLLLQVFSADFSKTLIGQWVEACAETLPSIQRRVVADAF